MRSDPSPNSGLLTPVAGERAPAAGLTDALSSAAGYALSEKADATRHAYRADIRHFREWCEAVGVTALPATPATVAAYLAALADRRLKVSTISRRAAAIAYAHKLASFEPPINESVKAVMGGIRRKLGTAQKGKAPATAAVVAKLVKRIPDTLAGKRDKALILIGFAAALRPASSSRSRSPTSSARIRGSCCTSGGRRPTRTDKAIRSPCRRGASSSPSKRSTPGSRQRRSRRGRSSGAS